MNKFKTARLFDKRGDLSKRWYVGYYFKHPETGKFVLFQIWISSKLRTRMARVQRANHVIDHINNRLTLGYNPFQNENPRLTNIIEALNVILNKKTTYTRKRTSNTYKSHCKIFFKWLRLEELDKLNIAALSFNHVLTFSDYLKITKKVSNRTHNNYVTSLRILFNDLIERDNIEVNPFIKVKYLPEEKRNIWAYSVDELSALKEYCTTKDPQLWLVCKFIFYLAIRPAELVQLKINNIDLKNQRVIIPGNISKNRKNGVINIPNHFYQELIIMEFEKYDPDLFLFSRNLEPGSIQIAPTRLSERFKVVKDKIGLKRRLYDLKHTAAGLAVQNGSNIRDLQLHLRHSDLKVTQKYLEAFQNKPSENFQSQYPIL